MRHASKPGAYLILPVLISLFAILLYTRFAAAGNDRDEWGDDWDDDRGEYYDDYDDDHDEYDDDYRGGYPVVVPYGYVIIPSGQLPPPGECRIWIPGVPPGQQPPPFDCTQFNPNVPAGGMLLYRPSY